MSEGFVLLKSTDIYPYGSQNTLLLSPLLLPYNLTQLPSNLSGAIQSIRASEYKEPDWNRNSALRFPIARSYPLYQRHIQASSTWYSQTVTLCRYWLGWTLLTFGMRTGVFMWYRRKQGLFCGNIKEKRNNTNQKRKTHFCNRTLLKWAWTVPLPADFQYCNQNTLSSDIRFCFCAHVAAIFELVQLRGGVFTSRFGSERRLLFFFFSFLFF